MEVVREGSHPGSSRDPRHSEDINIRELLEIRKPKTMKFCKFYKSNAVLEFVETAKIIIIKFK